MIEIKTILTEKKDPVNTILDYFSPVIIKALSSDDRKDEFNVLVDLIKTKTDIKKLRFDLNKVKDEKNNTASSLINNLKKEIENETDDAGKKVYSNDAKRKTELEVRLAKSNEYQGIQKFNESLSENMFKLDLAESTVRSLSNFLEK
jgi:phenylalanyl-tRNA synthetase alpha subunit